MKYLSDNEQLNSDAFQVLANKLQSPLTSKKIGNAEYSVYRAKDIFVNDWNSEELRRIVAEARKSYQKYYGDTIKLIDSYDSKSVVYLTLVKHTIVLDSDLLIHVYKWYSLRFIPGGSSPLSTEDLNFFVYHDGISEYSVVESLRKHMDQFKNLSDEDIFNQIVTQSRFCKTSFYADTNIDVNSIDKKKYGINNKINALISFSLMNQQFFSDIKENKQTFSILTCQMHEDMINNILSLNHPSGKKRLPFTKAYKLLSLHNEGSFYISRNKNGVYAYEYPGYFFDLHNLVDFIQLCIEKNWLSEETIKEYFDKSANVSEILREPHRKYFRNLGKLITTKGQINNSKITGEKLRELLNKYVKDGPYLHLIDIPEWKKEINSLLSLLEKHFILISNSQDYTIKSDIPIKIV